MRSVEERVIEIVGRAALMPAGPIRLDTRLSDLGIGSMETIESVLALEEAFRVEMPESGLWELRTVQDVVDAVKRAMAVNA